MNIPRRVDRSGYSYECTRIQGVGRTRRMLLQKKLKAHPKLLKGERPKRIMPYR